MTDDKWQDTLEQIRKNFGIEEQYTEEIADIPEARQEIVIFTTPISKIKVVRITAPKLLDKKTLFSGRAGSLVNVQKEYSEDEKVNYLEVYEWNEIERDWQKAQFNF